MTLTQLWEYVIVGGLCIGLPFAAFIAMRGILPSTWRVFGIGVLTYVFTQVILRSLWQAPLSAWANQHAATGWPYAGVMVVSAFVSALIEAFGLWAAYRWIIRTPSSSDSVALGLGHGGIEAVLLGIGVISTGLSFYTVTHHPVPHPGELERALLAQIHQALAKPWYTRVLPFYERIVTVALQVAQSVLLYVAYVRKRSVFFLAAVAVHTLSDSGIGIIATLLHHVWLSELYLTAVAGAVFVWSIRILRGERAAEAAAM